MKPRSALFLDLDGVVVLDEAIDQACIQRVNRLIEHCDVVVLSSSWRCVATDKLRDLGIPYAQWGRHALWTDRKAEVEALTGLSRIDACTPDVSVWDADVGGYLISVGDRALEIQQWLGLHPEVTDWVVLEDTPDWVVGLDPDHVVLCDSDTGFTDVDLDRALKILQVP